jgi:hypothetical protein
MSRLLAPRWPVSRRLTLLGEHASRSATCWIVQPLSTRRPRSSAPSSRRLAAGLPDPGNLRPVPPGERFSSQWTNFGPIPALYCLEMALANGYCQTAPLNQPGSFLKTRSLSEPARRQGAALIDRRRDDHGWRRGGASGATLATRALTTARPAHAAVPGAQHRGPTGSRARGRRARNTQRGRCSPHRPRYYHQASPGQDRSAMRIMVDRHGDGTQP